MLNGKKKETLLVEQFKRECKNYKKYNELERKAALKVKELENTLEGVHSPSWDKIGASGSRKGIDTIALMEEKNKWEARRNGYRDLQKLIDSYIMSIKPMAFASYVARECKEGESISKIAFAESRDAKELSLDIYKRICLYITPNMLQSIEDIKNSIPE